MCPASPDAARGSSSRRSYWHNLSGDVYLGATSRSWKAEWHQNSDRMDVRRNPLCDLGDAGPDSRMSTFGGGASAEVGVPASVCFDLVCDTPRIPEWHRAIKTVETLERDEQGRASLVRTRIDALVAQLEVDLRITYDEPSAVRMWRESGDLRDLFACWTFEDIGDGRAIASFSTEFDPGPLLSRFARGPLYRRLESLLAGQPPEGLKQAAESRLV